MSPDEITILRKKIAEHPKLSEEEQAELLALLPEPSPDQPAEDHDLSKELGDVGRELRHVIRKFEARHPEFTRLANQVLHYLSRMGI